MILFRLGYGIAVPTPHRSLFCPKHCSTAASPQTITHVAADQSFFYGHDCYLTGLITRMARKFLASLVDAPNAYHKPQALLRRIGWDFEVRTCRAGRAYGIRCDRLRSYVGLRDLRAADLRRWLQLHEQMSR
jgi:hypothetical protein